MASPFRDCSENITGVDAFEWAPRFGHLSEEGCPDFANLPRSAEI